MTIPLVFFHLIPFIGKGDAGQQPKIADSIVFAETELDDLSAN